MARALLEADGAAGAQLVLVPVALAGAELRDRVLRAGAVAAVALEAVAAGQAALGDFVPAGVIEVSKQRIAQIALGVVESLGGLFEQQLQILAR